MTLEKLAKVMQGGFKKADINLEKLAISTNKGFEDLEKRMDDRFNKVDERFKKVDERFDKVDTTIEHIRADLGSRLTSVERRTTILEAK